MAIKSNTHDKYKEILTELGKTRIAIKTISIPVEELVSLINEFDSLEHRYMSLQMGGTYGIRKNY